MAAIKMEIHGKVYYLVPADKPMPCKECALKDVCYREWRGVVCTEFYEYRARFVTEEDFKANPIV